MFKVNDGVPFGEKTYKGRDEDGVYEVEGLYTRNGKAISYKLGYPVFVTENDYDFDIEAYESYKNADDPKAEEDNQPLSGCFVQISNALSSSTSIVMVPQTLSGFDSARSSLSSKTKTKPLMTIWHRCLHRVM